jgi:hypothetical protein
MQPLNDLLGLLYNYMEAARVRLAKQPGKQDLTV